MKKAQICIFSLLSLAWGVFPQFPAWAENSVIITPNVLTLSTTRGENESRTIVLRTPKPLSNIKVTALDLHNAEGNKILPASSLRINSSIIAKDADGRSQSQAELVLQPLRVNNSSSSHPSGINLLTKVASLWQTAQGRLRLFYLSSYLISFTVLAGSGFNELYLSKPTFGANGWGDYLTLLVWGFGAEATRNMATQVVRKTDESDS